MPYTVPATTAGSLDTWAHMEAPQTHAETKLPAAPSPRASAHRVKPKSDACKGGRGPGNPRRLRVPHSPALFLSLAAREDPCCYATRVVGPEMSAHPTPGPAEQLSGSTDVTDKVSSPSQQLQHSNRFPPSYAFFFLNFPPPSSTRRHPPWCLSPQNSPQPQHSGKVPAVAAWWADSPISLLNYLSQLPKQTLNEPPAFPPRAGESSGEHPPAGLSCKSSFP